MDSDDEKDQSVHKRLDEHQRLIEDMRNTVNELNENFNAHVEREESFMTDDIVELAQYVRETKEATRMVGNVGRFGVKCIERTSKLVRWVMLVIAPFIFLWYWLTQDLKHAIEVFKGWLP